MLDVVFAERFGHNGVEIYGFIDGFDATCGLKAHGAAGEFAVFANGSAHHQRGFRRGSDSNLTGRGLDVVRSGIHRDDRGLFDLRSGFQFARFEDHLQGVFAANCLQFFDFIGAGFVISALESTNREHHIDFIGAIFKGERCFGRLHLDEGLRSGETAAHTSHAYAVGLQVLAHGGCEVGINTDGGQRRKVGMLIAPAVYAFGKAQDIFV